MSLDDLLMAIIIAGLGLSGAYLRAELLVHRKFRAADRRAELALHEVRINRVRPEQHDMPRQPRTHPSAIRALGAHAICE